jgi:hypothetical protein
MSAANANTADVFPAPPFTLESATTGIRTTSPKIVQQKEIFLAKWSSNQEGKESNGQMGI